MQSAGSVAMRNQQVRQTPGEGDARLDVHAGGVNEATQERQEQLLQLPLHQVGEHVAPRARRPRVLLVHLRNMPTGYSG